MNMQFRFGIACYKPGMLPEISLTEQASVLRMRRQMAGRKYAEWAGKRIAHTLQERDRLGRVTFHDPLQELVTVGIGMCHSYSVQPQFHLECLAHAGKELTCASVSKA